MAIRFHDVLLEFVRPGPPHNQLLSKLTPYMALCGEGSPITMHINMEHRQLLDRLERTRYVTLEGPVGGGNGRMTAREVPDRLRESAVEGLGEEIGVILRQAPSLLAELARIRGNEEGQDSLACVHLRLRLGGSELALLPFEMALSPQAHPGEGMEFCLQSTLPIVPTREIRRSRPLPISWNQQEFKLLIITASPGSEIPELAHVQALRQAVEPWVRWPESGPNNDPKEFERLRLLAVRDRLRILRNASIDDIRDICARESFTHVHILAHGDHRTDAGEARHGIALCDPSDKSRKQVVSGPKLAKALLAETADGNHRAQPVVVTLATCDSGNSGSVLVRGGSIAHDLHVEGIPWVFASQFPLTWRGSVRLVEELYPRILRGDDPRQALFEVRRSLFMAAQRDHDWASLVVYSSTPPDFDAQVSDFFESQTRWSIEMRLNDLDSALKDDTGLLTDSPQILQQLSNLEKQLELWRNRLPRQRNQQAPLSTRDREQLARDKERRAECFGMHGSVYKRIALIWANKAKAVDSDDHSEASRRASQNLEKAYGYYKNARNEWAKGSGKHHWVTTQYLSLAAVLDKGKEAVTLAGVQWNAKEELQHPDATDRAWAHGTMAELIILGLYHSQTRSKKNIERDVVGHCREIIRLAGGDSFAVKSTRRQFVRYRDHWSDPRWDKAVAAAVRELQSPEKAGK